MFYEDKRLASYHGKDPYLFLSYSHQDADQAAEIILRLKQAGFRVWYDEGVIPATEWDQNIARAIGSAAFFVSLISEAYLASSNCLDELNYARDLDKPQLLIYLEDVTLPEGLAMRLGRLLAIYKDRYDDPEVFYSRIFRAKGIKVCREETFVSETEGWEDDTAHEKYIEASSSGHTGRMIAVLLTVFIVLGMVCLAWHYRSQIRGLISDYRYSHSYSQQSGGSSQTSDTFTPVPEISPDLFIEPTDTDTSAEIITTETPTPAVTPTPTPTPTPTLTPTPSPSELIDTVVVGPPVPGDSPDNSIPGFSDEGFPNSAFPDNQHSDSTAYMNDNVEDESDDPLPINESADEIVP